jgi:TolB-like protein
MESSMNTIRRTALAFAVALTLAPVLVRAQDTRPVVAVLYFDNNSIGKDRADFDGLGKGIADLLITDLASSPRMRIVERERVQKLLEEQSLTKSGAIDPSTAVKLGKVLGAQYMVTGGFMSDGRGSMVLTSRAINVETSQITNPERVQEKTDDVLGLVAKLSTRLNENLKLPAIAPQRTGDASRGNGSAKQSGEPAKSSGAAKVPAQRVAQASAPRKPVKLDVRTALLYSKALEEQDSGRSEKAAELYRQVLTKFPDFEQAKHHYATVSKKG